MRQVGLYFAGLLFFTCAQLSAAQVTGVAQTDTVRTAGCAPADSLRLPSADLAGETADLARVAQLDGNALVESFMIRRTSQVPHVLLCSGPASYLRKLTASAASQPSSSISLTPIHLRLTQNSAYPDDSNNGALWAGKGLSAEIDGGVKFQWRFFSAAVAPMIAFQQNAEFDIAPVTREIYSPFSDTWHPQIDYPQRFGSKSYWTIDPGQSYLRMDYRGLGFGVSTENLWWGPARKNPIILSNTAPGIPHAFLESSKPIDIGIGDAEFQVLIGRLVESDFYDFDPTNDIRFFSGLAAVLEPRGLDNLFIGGSRVQHTAAAPEDLSLRDLLLGPYRGVLENTLAENQLLSLFFRWVGPASGLEVYGEWAREDHWGSLRLLLQVPDGSQAYTIGLQKVLRFGENRLRIGAETTHLEDALPILHAGRGVLTYYTHTGVVQGHTQRGQILGAGIGPGSESQYLGADLYWRYGRTGLSLDRTRFDDDTYYSVWSSFYGPNAHDVELSTTVSQTFARGPLLVTAALGYNQRENRMFVGLDGSNTNFRKDTNWSFDLTATLQSLRF